MRVFKDFYDTRYMTNLLRDLTSYYDYNLTSTHVNKHTSLYISPM